MGKPSYAAIRGEQVTCSFGGHDALAHDVEVLAERCPDTSPFYVFYSTAADATDTYVYFGSEASRLYRMTRQAANRASETQQACTNQ